MIYILILLILKTCIFYSALESDYSWKKFEKQLHSTDFDEFDKWQNLEETYFKLDKSLRGVYMCSMKLDAT